MTPKMTPKPPKTRCHSKLSFDPGHTTGIAFHDGSEVVFTCTVHYTKLDRLFVETLVNYWKPQEIVVEKVPAVYPDKTTIAMFYRIVEACRGCSEAIMTTVSPGTWKPVRAKHTQFWKEHLKDAVDLLFYNT